MKKNLIIVESPAKAKTIGNFLGKEYEVIASKGHIRDLPKSSFGIKIENDKFIPEYRITSDHSVLVKELKEKAKGAKEIYLATDEDKACHIDFWASLFKARTWEELHMLSQNNEYLKEASETVYHLTQEEKVRLQCQAREDYYRRMKGIQEKFEQLKQYKAEIKQYEAQKVQ